MTKIFALILTLLQAQPTRIPKLVWAGAIIIFLGGISMLIYFLRGLKKGEKEQEEDDWRTSRRSLFVEPEPPSTESKTRIEPAAEPVSQSWSDAGSDESDDVAVAVTPLIEPSAPPPRVEPPPAAVTAPPPRIEPPPAPVAAPPPRVEPPPADVAEPPVEKLDSVAHDEERGTQLLVSEPVPPADEGAVLADDVWAELEAKAPPVPPAPPPVARVEQRGTRESFVPPAIRPYQARAPFEAPRIDRITPRNAPAPGSELSRKAFPVSSDQAQAEPRSAASHLPTPDAAAEPSVGAVPVGAGRKPSGSVLGLPAESSRGPLILGESQQRADVGIGSLSNYGKEIAPEGGRGGLIALVVTILIVGGGTLAYLFLPSVHQRVDTAVARLRGDPPPEAPAPPAQRPKAQIVFGVSEAVKNMVKARGSVYNVSTEPLENLSIEVGLFRTPEGPPDTRTIQLVPNRLDPAQQGRFEFEYDGSKDKGYPAGYRALRLLSKDEEVKFMLPGQRAQ